MTISGLFVEYGHGSYFIQRGVFGLRCIEMFLCVCVQTLEAQTEAAQSHRVLPHVSYLDGRGDDPARTLVADLTEQPDSQQVCLCLYSLCDMGTIIVRSCLGGC